MPDIYETLKRVFQELDAAEGKIKCLEFELRQKNLKLAELQTKLQRAGIQIPAQQKKVEVKIWKI